MRSPQVERNCGAGDNILSSIGQCRHSPSSHPGRLLHAACCPLRERRSTALDSGSDHQLQPAGRTPHLPFSRTPGGKGHSARDASWTLCSVLSLDDPRAGALEIMRDGPFFLSDDAGGSGHGVEATQAGRRNIMQCPSPRPGYPYVHTCMYIHTYICVPVDWPRHSSSPSRPSTPSSRHCPYWNSSFKSEVVAPQPSHRGIPVLSSSHLRGCSCPTHHNNNSTAARHLSWCEEETLRPTTAEGERRTGIT